MKQSSLILTLSLILIVGLIGVVYYFSSSSLDDSKVQLNIDDFRAFTDGQVFFNVSLVDSESEVLDEIVLDNVSYSWSEGSLESSTITKGEVKGWSIDVGALQNQSVVEVVIETPTVKGVGNTIVQSVPSDNVPSGESEDIYNYYGGVGLFDEGIHVVATAEDPTLTLYDYEIVNSFWEMLAEHETVVASEEDFISIILSRGDKPTGGYYINFESFSWVESYPVKFLFQVNVTDPDEGMMVTDALTNPLVLIPIDKLTAGEYNIEVNLTWFIENIDETGKIVYNPVMTFAPIQWKQTLTIMTSN